jgi:uncharacterized protein
VLEAARDRRITVIASWSLAEEIVDVLRRPKLRRYGLSQEDLRGVLVLLAPLLPTIDLEKPLRDPDDAPVVAAAVRGRADAIVTGDRDLLDDAELRVRLSDEGVELLTPAELLARLSS